MAFQPVPGTARFAVIYDRAGQLMVNVLHFDRSDDWGLNQLVDACYVLIDQYRQHVFPHLHRAVRLSRVESRGLRAQEDVAAVVSPPQVVEGQRGMDLTPGNVAFVISHSTGLTGRSTRGRTYFGGFSEEEIAGDTIKLTTALGLGQALYAVKDAMLAIGWRMVVVSRVANKTRRPEGRVYPVHAFKFTDLVLDCQRRRLAKRGA